MKPKLRMSVAVPQNLASCHSRSLRRCASTLALISISLAFSQPVQAASAWWDGGAAGVWGTNTNWNTAADGSGGDTVPGVGETATFNITGLNQNELVAIGTATLSVAGMVFDNTGTTGINAAGSVGSSNTVVTLGSGGLTMNSGAGAVTFANANTTGFRTAFVLGAAQTWTNNSTAGALTLSGTTGGTVNNGGNLLTLDGSGDISIAGIISGAGGLTKNGTGAVLLTGANSYGGGTTLNNGTLKIGANSAGSVGAITSSAVGTGALVLNGGTLSANAGTARTILNALTIGGNVTLGDATNNGALTFSANASLGGGTRTLTTASSVTFSTGVIDNGGIIKAGSGMLTLSGANTYVGGTTITSGTLSVGASNNLGGAASNLVFDGGTLQITGTALTNFTGIGHTVSFNANKTVGLDINGASNTFTADQVLNQGTGGLTKFGGGFLVLDQANTYSGVTTITAGQVNITAANNVGDGSATNSITLGGGTLALTAGTVDLGTNRAITLLADSLLQVDTGAQLTVSGLITGGFRLTVVGQGTTILSNPNNSFTDLTLGNNSTSPIVQVSSIANATIASPLGSGSLIRIGAGDRDPVLRLVGSAAPQTTDRTIGVSSGAGSNGTSTIANDNTDANNSLTFTASAFNFPTTASGGGKTLILAGSNTGNNAINGVIVDNTGAIVRLTKDGTGTWVLAGNNTYTGLTTVAQGKLSLARVGGTILDTGAVTVTGGTLDVAQSDTVGLVTMTGGTISGAGTLTGSSFVFDNTVAATASAVLAGSAGAGSTLTKTGIGGTAVLSGANTYAGKTTIGQGFLSVSSLNYVTSGTWGTHSASNLGAPVTVADGTISLGQAAQRGTLIYTGTGETTDRVIDMAGGAGGAAIDQSGSGLLKFTSALTMSSVVTTNKTLYLLGSTGGSGEFAGAIANGGAGGPTVVNVDKDGSGTWTLSGNNTYTGATTVNAGTLVLADNAQLTFKTGATSGTGNNLLSGAGTVTLNGDFVIDTSATDATALTSGSWVIENAASLPGAYGGTFTVFGWTDAGSETWTKTVGSKNYTFNELDGTVSMVGVSDPYAAWIATYEPNALLPDAASKLPGADPDGDGLNNLLEFTLSGSPVVSSQSIRPAQTVNATDIILTFKRSDASESPVTTQTVQISTDLVDWTTIPAITIGPITDVPTGLTVTEGVNPTDPDDIIVTIPRSGSLKKFVRLNVVK